MLKLTAREKQLIRAALRIAREDGSIYPTGADDDDILLAKKIDAEIEEIEYKLSASWNRNPT